MIDIKSMEDVNRLMEEIPSVENMTSHNGNSVPNQFIIQGNGWRLFQSYSSPIALIIGGKVYLFKDWNYSRTTGKYRNMFLGENQKETERQLKSGVYKPVDFEVEA
jgi:hypothetical protein